jgi:hypothetical protein
VEPSVEPDRPLRRLLAAAEDASPVAAVEAVTRQLGVALCASSVSLLIADLSRRALVRDGERRTRQRPADGARRGDGERTTVLPCRCTCPEVRWALRRARS